MTLTLRKEIEKLAKTIAKEAQESEHLSVKVDALKVLAGFYPRPAVKGKVVAEPADDEPTIEAIQRRLHIVEEKDGGTVHARKGRS